MSPFEYFNTFYQCIVAFCNGPSWALDIPEDFHWAILSSGDFELALVRPISRFEHFWTHFEPLLAPTISIEPFRAQVIFIQLYWAQAF